MSVGKDAGCAEATSPHESPTQSRRRRPKRGRCTTYIPNDVPNDVSSGRYVNVRTCRVICAGDLDGFSILKALLGAGFNIQVVADRSGISTFRNVKVDEMVLRPNKNCPFSSSCGLCSPVSTHMSRLCCVLGPWLSGWTGCGCCGRWKSLGGKLTTENSVRSP